MQVGIAKVKGVFILDEFNIIQENFLEDLNNFLNSGEVPFLFTSEEVMTLMGYKDPISSESEKVRSWH